MREEVKRWLDKAKGDLRKAKDNFKLRNYDLTSFLCQQSIEKALKALLIKKTNNFPKIHDLTNLAKLNNAPIEIIELCAKLNPAYIVSRYPDSLKEYTIEECKYLIKCCQEVLRWIEKNLD